MKFAFLPVLLFWASASLAQQYNVNLIPDSLKKNANVVKRLDEETLEIRSPGKAIVHTHVVYTILDESADEYGEMETAYGAFNTINTISGTLYDAMGNKLKHFRKADMEDFSNNDNALMGDERYKKYNFYCKNYPYTVDFEEEDEINGILFFDNWVPVGKPKQAVQQSSYTIIAPKNYAVRFKALHCNYQPVIAETGDKKSYRWTAKNFSAMFSESQAPSWLEIVPVVLMAPSEFEAQGYSGNMSSWEGYGKFMNQLLKGRDVLPDIIKKKVHEITAPLKTDREKVYALYDFLQKNTHYISIQLGIGGWQPFDASYVASKRYGDCKALSNYMIAMLKEAGIQGKYVEIRARSNAAPMITDFPSFQSNHVISCVPMGKDTIWLECTSQTESPDYMGSFTGNRKAVLIDESGAHIVSTPYYNSSDNLQIRQVSASIDGDGNLDADLNTTYTGVRQELAHELMAEVSKEFREKYLNEALNLPTYRIEKTSYEEEKGKIPVVKEYMHVLSPGYSSISGKRLFVNPDLFTKSNEKLNADSTRKYDIVCREAFKEIDSISLKIPAGYKPESVPGAVSIENKFGKYNTSVKLMPDKILYYRSFEKYDGRFPAKDYSDLAKFYDQIYRSDRRRVVLLKTE